MGLFFSLLLAQAAPEAGAWSLIGAVLWAFLNSPLGVTLVSAVVVAILGKLWTAKPEWQKLLTENRGHFFDAVRFAEKAIPDDTQGSAAAKADAALKYLLRLEGPLSQGPFSQASSSDLKQALIAAHAQVEKKDAA